MSVDFLLGKSCNRRVEESRVLWSAKCKPDALYTRWVLAARPSPSATTDCPRAKGYARCIKKYGGDREPDTTFAAWWKGTFFEATRAVASVSDRRWRGGSNIRLRLSKFVFNPLLVCVGSLHFVSSKEESNRFRNTCAFSENNLNGLWCVALALTMIDARFTPVIQQQTRALLIQVISFEFVQY